MAAGITLDDGLLTVTGTGQADVIRISMVRNTFGKVLPVRVTVAAAVGAALEAGVAVAAPEDGEPLTLQQRVPGAPNPFARGQIRRHLEQGPP